MELGAEGRGVMRAVGRAWIGIPQTIGGKGWGVGGWGGLNRGGPGPIQGVMGEGDGWRGLGMH